MTATVMPITVHPVHVATVGLPHREPRWTNYSATKYLALHAYYEHASRWRVFVVLILTPLPALLGSAMSSLVPLQNPMRGFSSNQSVLIHETVALFMISVGGILLTLGGTMTTRTIYPKSKVVAVAAVSTAITMVFSFALHKLWRFPTPFIVLLEAPLWIFAVLLAHRILLRTTFKKYPHLMSSLSRYKLPLLIQTSQFFVYAGLTVVFDRVSTWYQVLLIVLFPVVKYLLKRMLRQSTQALDEMAAEVALSTVEISASLYQAMIMQGTPSTLALCTIMAVDVTQGFASIKLFMDRHLETPRHEVFPRALQILQRCQKKRANSTRHLATLRAALDQEEALVVEEALRLASVADKILLIEYFEVSVPIVSALFLLLTYKSTSTLYNTRINKFNDNSELVASATRSVLLYSFLQGISMVVFAIVLRRRHNMSAFYHLAFVLEYHMRSIQGKLLMFFTLIFYFTLLHYGADFSLRLNLEVLMSEMKFPPSCAAALDPLLGRQVPHSSRVLLTPLPALVGSALPSLVPLQNPLLGYAANQAHVVHSFLAIFLLSLGAILLTIGGTSTPRHMYSELRVLAVSVVTTAIMIALSHLVTSQWRFPVPFYILLFAPIWIVAFALAHAIVLYDNFKRYPQLFELLSSYTVPLALQTSQFDVYAGLTVLFDRVSTLYQILLISLFPIVKFLLKKMLRHQTQALEERSLEVAISTVEICASLYQAMIMQSAQSTLALCAIMGVDVAQGFVSIKFFMGRHMQTSRREVVTSAVLILQRYQSEPRDTRALPASLRAQLSEHDAFVVGEALELASATDKVLLVEYFEVSVPVVASLFLLLTYQSSSTLYNTRLNRFYDNSELVASATQSVLVYSLLQGVSVVVFHFVLRWRYNMSALYHLAFVLEYHMRSIQGKLLCFFPVIFYFTLLHYGADFSLRFDFADLMAKLKLPVVETDTDE